MPVFLRKNTALSPPMGSDIDYNQDEDYLLDQDQFRDILPQPYRMINKVLLNLVDGAWEVIADREKVRIREESKIRPPKYECTIKLQQEHGNAHSICHSRDGEVVFIGLQDGLVAVNAKSQETLDIWQDDSLQVVDMKSSQLSSGYHLITTLDDMGACRIFAFCGNTIFLLQSVNYHGDGKMLAAKCEPSIEGDYIGVFFESSDNKTGCLEIHKCPKDVWLKELETILEKYGLSQSKTEQDTSKETEANSENNEGEETTHSAVPSGTPMSSKDERMQHKFTSTTLVAKLLPPSPPQGTSWSSPIQIAKTVDSGDVIGTGANHQVSQQHLELRWDTFRHFHQQHLPYLKEEEPNVSQPTFHFLTPGSLMPQGLDNAVITGFEQPTVIGLWWSGHHHFRHYSLLKQMKVEAELKPDIVWPYSSPIAASCTSACTSLIAIALRNNNIIVWNKYLGFCQRMTKLDLQLVDVVEKMEFLDPCICPQSDKKNSLDSQMAVYLMICTKEGQMFLLTCGNGDESPARDISAEIEKEDEKYTLIQCMEGIPELILTARVNGRVYIHNVLTGHVICEVMLPDNYGLGSLWQPVITTAAAGQMTFIGGKIANSDSTNTEKDDVSTNENLASVFAFDLSLTPLSVYQEINRPTLPYVTHFTVNQRIDTILRNRISQQPARKERMERRWKQLKMELQSMKRASGKTNSPSKSALNTTAVEKSLLNGSGRPSQTTVGV